MSSNQWSNFTLSSKKRTKLMETITTADGKKFLELGFEPQNGWIRCTWFGNVPPSDISRGIAHYQSLLRRTKCSKLLNDNSRFEANWISVNDALEQGGMAESAKNGLRYMAHVHSSRFITRFSAVDLGTRVRDFEFKIFEDLKDAEEWLHNVPA